MEQRETPDFAHRGLSGHFIAPLNWRQPWRSTTMELTLRIVQKKPAIRFRTDVFNRPIDCIRFHLDKMLVRVLFCRNSIQLGDRHALASHGIFAIVVFRNNRRWNPRSGDLTVLFQCSRRSLSCAVAAAGPAAIDIDAESTITLWCWLSVRNNTR